MNESQAFKSLEQQLAKVDETFIKYSQDRMIELDKEIEDARAEKDFPRFKTALEGKNAAIDDLINAHNKRMEILVKMKESINSDLQGALQRGEKVFMGEKLEYFSSENFKKGERIRIESNNYFLELEKTVDDKNQFVLQDMNIEGLKLGDIIQVGDFNLGGDAKMTVYRKVDQRYESMGETVIENVSSLVKDPA